MADPLTIAMVSMAAGTIMSTGSQLASARDTKNIANMNAANTRKVAEYNAAISRQSAGQEEAASQIRANEAKRQSRLMQSRVLALASASGGGAMDQDVMNIISGFESEGDLAARTELYQGSERASQHRANADAGLWQGETEARNIRYRGLSESSAMRNKAFGTLMEGASSLAAKYGSFGGGVSKSYVPHRSDGLH